MNLVKFLLFGQLYVDTTYGHPNVEMFLSQVGHENLKEVKSPLGYLNLSKEEWKALRCLVIDRNIVIKKADKGSCVVIWDRSDYIIIAEK